MSDYAGSKTLRKVTLAAVALLARVSLVTASYALRNNPKISLPTRERVHRAAKKLGYVPDPEMCRLMRLLRVGRAVGSQSTIALLSIDAQMNEVRNPFYSVLVEGANARCAELGYRMDPMTFRPGELTPKRLTQVLHSRGIQGILIPPLRQPVDCSGLLEWNEFSVVAATHTAQNIKVNRVVPNHMQIGLLALEKLEERGHRRIGLVTEPDDHARNNYGFLAAQALHQQMGKAALIPAIQFREPVALREWLRRYRPEIILTNEHRLGLLIADLMANDLLPSQPIILLNNPGHTSFDGVYQHPEIVGRRAVDLLASKIQLGESGGSAHPNVQLIEGSWITAEAGLVVAGQTIATKGANRAYGRTMNDRHVAVFSRSVR